MRTRDSLQVNFWIAVLLIYAHIVMTIRKDSRKSIYLKINNIGDIND